MCDYWLVKASKLFGVPEKQVTKEQRAVAKMVYMHETYSSKRPIKEDQKS